MKTISRKHSTIVSLAVAASAGALLMSACGEDTAEGSQQDDTATGGVAAPAADDAQESDDAAADDEPQPEQSDDATQDETQPEAETESDEPGEGTDGDSDGLVFDSGVAGDLQLPAETDEVRDTFTERWGPPDLEETGQGCATDSSPVPEQLFLGWDGVTFYGTPNDDGGHDITGWAVRLDEASTGISLPYDVHPGDDWEAAMQQLPDAEPIESPIHEVVTEADTQLIWTSDETGQYVDFVIYNHGYCGE